MSSENSGLERVRHQLKSSGVKNPENDPHRSGIHTRGYLPHVKREGASYFVTFRLADSLPQEVLLQFEKEKAERLHALNLAKGRKETAKDSESIVARDFSRAVERYLDKGIGKCWLGQAEIGQLVADALQFFHEERYLLRDWVVMPNHVHVIVWPMPNVVLGEILKSWKGFTSRKAKQLLGLKEGPFWQTESYNHWIRNDDEHARIARYIRNNPVTAGLCAQPEDWPWSSASRRNP